MKPLELHIYDFDGSLYDSPRPKDDRPDWWFSAKSLQGYGGLGEDPKWILSTVVEARRSILAPWVKTAVLTGRPHQAEMQATIKKMLAKTGLNFDIVKLKPLFPPDPTPVFKAKQVLTWLRAAPTVTRVIFYDDLPENLSAVGDVVRQANLSYTGIRTAGVS